MAEQPLAPCPVCGGEPQLLQDLFGELLERGDRALGAAVRARAEAPPQRPRTGQDVPGEAFFQAVNELPGEVLRRAVAPSARRAAAAAERANQARRQAMRLALDRHPGLLCCQRDDMVYRARGRRGVPTRDPMRLLMRGDEVGLIAALNS
jgi:hypothetical protein